MTFTCVVEVGQCREVGELLSGFIPLIILLEDLDSFIYISFEICGIYAVVSAAAVSVLIELGTIGLGHTHSYEGACRKLSGLADLFADVVSVEQKADSLTDLRLLHLVFYGNCTGAFISSG